MPDSLFAQSGVLNIAVGFGNDIVKFQPTQQWKINGVNNLRQIESTSSLNLGYGMRKSNFEYGINTRINRSYLNRFYSQIVEPINKVYYYNIGGYFKGWFNNGRKIQPFLLIESGLLIHYPEKIGRANAEYGSRMFAIIGLGLSVKISKSFLGNIFMTNGPTPVNFGLSYIFKS